MKRIAVIGAGSWGTALAFIAGQAGHDVRLWARQKSIANEINQHRTNIARLANCTLPESVTATVDLSEALNEAEMILLVSPSHVTREVLTTMLPCVQSEMIFVSATKGIEVETCKRVSEIVEDVLARKFKPRFVCLSGPSFAQEVLQGHPTAVTAASEKEEDARIVQGSLSKMNFRIYTNDDVIGTEIGGSVKNVMAIAAGMVTGLGFGANSVAALITRGLAEMSRLAVAMGGQKETLAGLAGLGDLVLTCTGSLSRNRHVGQELSKGRKLQDIIGEMREVAEGIKTAVAVKELARRYEVEMPITNEVYDVLYIQRSVRDAAESLMTRPLKGE